MNRWREVLCTTPMRLTLRLVVLFVAISLVAFGATWWLANNALIDATETTLQQQIDALSASDRPEEIARFLDRIGKNPEQRKNLSEHQHDQKEDKQQVGRFGDERPKPVAPGLVP